ncbi:MAG: methionyl-tRNA formyltransferase [Clostridiales bacterium]|jgi:methionyl-tRNA formyltransferase|nr:methionyl-tRNA formyltransferase [Clostridiales bacterium]
MKIIFMGTPEFALPSLEALLRRHSVAAAVTQPDKPSGRGGKVRPTPVKESALKHGVPVMQPARVKNFYNELAAYEPDVIVVAAYGQILPETILSIPAYMCINVHASLLPRYRGPAPIQRAVMDGAAVTGVTIMAMDKGLDTGDILLKKETEITPKDTAGLLSGRLAQMGAEALMETLELIERGCLQREKQDESLATYAPMLDKGAGRIDWYAPGRTIVNLIRGMNPQPGAYTYCDGNLIKIWFAEDTALGGPEKPGEIAPDARGLIAGTGAGAILVTELQAGGGKKMSAADYARGHGIKAGSCFN